MIATVERPMAVAFVVRLTPLLVGGIRPKAVPVSTTLIRCLVPGAS